MLKTFIITISGLLLIGTCAVLTDWLLAYPADKPAEYVGRQTCAECHQAQHELWRGSHHDLAMDHATKDTVLGDFNQATLEHFGVTSTMFTKDGKYYINTEGPDGKMADFEIKFVFGVEPLQQYMVELVGPDGLAASDHPSRTQLHLVSNTTSGTKPPEIGKLQVLRVSWDTEKKRWFYLSPPDVDEKLAANDQMHWTGAAQNWNHMCASCHSTGYQKNFDVTTKTFHSTYSEIDVSCETCHGPGSTHVELATANSLFWDRNLGYGLKQLKGSDSQPQIEACAPCHSRRRVVHPDDPPGQDYYDCFVNELLMPDTYYCDGQILDEVYVYGSFIQSKMYHKGVRCSDCHDPHSNKLKFEGNAMCVSCHDAHPKGKYDTPSHHHHQPGSAGAQCVNCHMPATPYMEVDFRRDHSLRIPRPDLSVDLATPNACSSCHLEIKNIPADKRASLPHYAAWMEKARAGDQHVKSEIQRVDKWMADTCDQWYPNKYGKKDHFAYTLSRAWNRDPSCSDELRDLARLRKYPSIVRASALFQLAQLDPEEAIKLGARLVDENDPQIRNTAAMILEAAPLRERLEKVRPLLYDPLRSVRAEAARILADLELGSLNGAEMEQRDKMLEVYRRGLQDNGDLAMSHLGLAILAERQGKLDQAVESYRTAIKVQPDVVGPRSNLAELYARAAEGEDPQSPRAKNALAEVKRLRGEELQLFERDVQLLPNSAVTHYRYGLSLYLDGQYEKARDALAQAAKLDPSQPAYQQAFVELEKMLQQLKGQ